LKLDRETEALLYWTSSSTATPLWCLSPDAAREEYRRHPVHAWRRLRSRRH
jgi:hypothetical protein